MHTVVFYVALAVAAVAFPIRFLLGFLVGREGSPWDC